MPGREWCGRAPALPAQAALPRDRLEGRLRAQGDAVVGQGVEHLGGGAETFPRAPINSFALASSASRAATRARSRASSTTLRSFGLRPAALIDCRLAKRQGLI